MPSDFKPEMADAPALSAHPLLSERNLEVIFGDSRPIDVVHLSSSSRRSLFHLTFDRPPFDWPTDLVLTFESRVVTQHVLGHIGDMKRLAALSIPELVPPTYSVGTVTHLGKPVAYSVVKYIEGQELTNVWEDLEPDEQIRIVDSLVEAMVKVKSVDWDNPQVREIFEGSLLYEGDHPVHLLGGPYQGYFTSAVGWLEEVCFSLNIESDVYFEKGNVPDPGIMVGCDDDPSQHRRLSGSQLEQFRWDAVFAHNDVQLSKVIVRWSAENGYELAGLIGWDQAGFVPPAYVVATLETGLGCTIEYYDFYTLMRERAVRAFLPAFPDLHLQGHDQLAYIVQSMTGYKTVFNKLDPHWVKRHLWLKREQLAYDYQSFHGWIRRPGAGSDGATAIVPSTRDLNDRIWRLAGAVCSRRKEEPDEEGNLDGWIDKMNEQEEVLARHLDEGERKRQSELQDMKDETGRAIGEQRKGLWRQNRRRLRREDWAKMKKSRSGQVCSTGVGKGKERAERFGDEDDSGDGDVSDGLDGSEGLDEAWSDDGDADLTDPLVLLV